MTYKPCALKRRLEVLEANFTCLAAGAYLIELDQCIELRSHTIYGFLVGFAGMPAEQLAVIKIGDGLIGYRPGQVVIACFRS